MTIEHCGGLLAEAMSDNGACRPNGSSGLINPAKPPWLCSPVAGNVSPSVRTSDCVFGIPGIWGLHVRCRLPSVPTAVAVRFDNQRLAVGDADGRVTLWNVNGSEPLARWSWTGPIRALAFSPDNQKLAVADQQGLHMLAAPNPPRAGVELEPQQDYSHSVPLTALVFAPDSVEVHAGDASGKHLVWLYAAAQPIRQFNHGGPVYGVALDATGSTLVSASADQTVRIWDAQSGQQRAQLSGHQGAVYAVALSPDAALAVSSGTDRTLRLWDVVGGRQLKLLATLPETAYALAVHPEGNRVLAAGADRKARLLDLLTGSEQRVYEGHPDFIHGAAFQPNGARLLTYGYAGHLRLWNMADGQLVWEAKLDRVGNGVASSPDGTRIVLANADGTVAIVPVPETVR
ncbi:MAG: hypothetical protein KatS3mg110_1667 [Pirellulaceae bacterium]|nr:MAG: hypothetical protein KatS3mg110_1665 [Pirellulaceae bacterium]GIW93626.1 MAG: hypothetical protein KatS3mg110_1667 [Pirellulaceae bacterium]